MSSSMLSPAPPQSTLVAPPFAEEKGLDNRGPIADGWAVSQSDAVVHKHPFAPLCLDEEPTGSTVFRQVLEEHNDRRISRHQSRSVRVFIGPIKTNWMQGHQRWWIKTAEKFETSKGSTRDKIRRRKSQSKPSHKDKKHDIFSSGRKNRSSQSLSSLSSTESSESNSSSGSEMQESDWSSVSADALSSPEIAPTTPDPRNSRSASISRRKVDSETASDASLGHNGSAADGTDDSAQQAKRKSSLSAIKSLFRRSHSSHDQHTRSDTTATSGHRQGVGAVAGAQPADARIDAVAAETGLLRRGSIDGMAYPLSADKHMREEPTVGRKSLDASAGSPKQTSLRRVAVTKRARSVTWQPQLDLDPVRTPAAGGPQLRSPDTQTETSTQRPPQVNREDTPVTRSPLSKWGGPRRAMAAKVKAYYHRHAQISETTVILSTRAVVRRETASCDAYTSKYNEATCQKFRHGSQGWTEMWLALTKRGILFYLTSSKRPTVQVFFPPHISVAPRVSLFSTLDLSIAITYFSRHQVESLSADKRGKKATGGVMPDDSEPRKDGVRVVIIKFPSSQIACEWYREIGQILFIERALYPYCFSGPSPPAAQTPPSSVLVSIPELGVKVQAKLGRHNEEIPSSLLGEAADSHMEHLWRCETTTVWHIRRDVVNALLGDKVIGPRIQEWLEAEKKGLLTIGMAWRRFDRLDWVMPCGADSSKGKLQACSTNETIVGPQLLEGTHCLEMRILEHYPDSVNVDEAHIAEPLAVEGFVMLKRDKLRRADIVVYRPALLTSHDNYLFFIHAPRASRHLDVSANECGDPFISPDECQHPNGYGSAAPGVSPAAGSASGADPVVRYYHPDMRTCPKQMSLAKYMLDITEVDHIVPMSQAAEHTANGDEQRPVTATPVDTDNRSSLSIQPTTNSDSRSSLREKGKGKVLGFLRSKKNRQAACKLKLTTRAGATVVIWTSSEECTDEWIRRLLDLRTYWVHRRLSDSSLRSQVCALNYMLQGRRSREKDMPDWNDEKAWADRAIWHACLVLGCRDIIISGMLYRKRHRHQGMRKVFCILTRGRLVEYKYPESPSSPPRSALADQANSVYTNSAGLLSGMASSTSNLMAGDPADPGSAGSSGNSKARLLFGRSRSLSLRRCYVMSRFIDDLTTQDIMCEPWVMTDISNYSGLRLADRLYADGVISHELVQDCIFTVWRPTFVPAILRSGKTPKIKTIPEEALGEISEESVDEQPASVGSEPKSSSPNGKSYPTAGQAAAVSFEPGSSTREHSDSRDRAMAPTALGIQVGESPSETGSSPQGSVRRQRPSADALRRSGEVTRKSNETSRISGDGYLSSMSNKSNGKPVDTSKPGAYRIGDKITVNVDDRHDGIKRMGAIGMVSSMRRRMGVYKARTSAEMEQWVTAINQEIRRMAAAGDW